MAKKSANKTAAKEAKKAKQATKALKKGADLIDDEPSITDILKELESKQQKKINVVEVCSSPPGARSSFSFLSPKGSSFLIFGGEFYDAKSCQVFNDLFKWNPGKEEEWKQIKNSVEPKPRCGHQAVMYQDDLYLFGGEFATAQQFYHFRDLWRFETKTNTWHEIVSPGGPSPRSGHRMVVCRNTIVLFGGFHDNAKETRYHNDVFVFFPGQDLWRKLAVSGGPSARSGVIMGANNDGVIIHGGYAKAKDSDKGAQGVTFGDTYWLDMRPVFADPKNGLPIWERLGRKGLSVKRNGVGATMHKDTLVIFGGVVDEDEGGLTLKDSMFYNDILLFEIGSKRWTQFTFKSSKKRNPSSDATTPDTTTPDAPTAMGDDELNSPKNTDSGTSRLCAFAERNGKLWKINLEAAKQPEVEVNFMVDPRQRSEPLPRMSASIAIKDNYLYIMGGTLEVGAKTLVLDDCWRVHLTKRTPWEVVIPGTYWQKEWKDDVSSDDDSSDEDGSLESDVTDYFSEIESLVESSSDEDDLRAALKKALDEIMEKFPDGIRPDPEQTLKDFFGNTKEFWKLRAQRCGDEFLSEKQISQKAFELASERYAGCRETFEKFEV